MLDGTVTLHTECLFSKWGFCDGDLFSDFLWEWADVGNIDIRKLDKHLVLIRVLKEFLLPALNKKVEVYTIPTIHNPIRVKAIAGVPVSDDVIYGDAPSPILIPESVDVPLKEVIRIAKEILEEI